MTSGWGEDVDVKGGWLVSIVYDFWGVIAFENDQL